MNMGYLAQKIISGDALHNPLKYTRKPPALLSEEKI